MMSRIMRGALFGIFLGIVGGLAIGSLTYENQETDEEHTAVLAVSDDIVSSEEGDNADEETELIADAGGVLRFHIRANSDSVEDQMIKMDVKEYALSILSPVAAEAQSFETAKRLIEAKLPFLKSELENYMQKAGYTYQVEVYFTTEYFPLKQYGDVTFPAGEYEALRIDIGEVEGQNWWCVMYPSLCFIDATHAVLPVEEKEKLESMLTKEEYDFLVSRNEAEDDTKNVVFYHSKLVDTVKAWIK